MRPPNEDIPLLTDVVVPGRQGVPGEGHAHEQPPPRPGDTDEHPTHHTIFGDDDPAQEIDVGVEMIIDNVLEKHILRMRAELIAEVTALLDPAVRRK